MDNFDELSHLSEDKLEEALQKLILQEMTGKPPHVSEGPVYGTGAEHTNGNTYDETYSSSSSSSDEEEEIPEPVRKSKKTKKQVQYEDSSSEEVSDDYDLTASDSDSEGY